MDFQLHIITCALLLLLASLVDRAQSVTFDVRKYGAQPNGDITKVRSYYVYTT